MNKLSYVSKDDLLKFLFSADQLINPEDLGWWLECKTSNKFTVIEREFIIQTLNTLDEISKDKAAIVQSFKDEWLAKLHTLSRAGGYEYKK